eukprot:7103493-Pyramimonas_sp.AAC.1
MQLLLCMFVHASPHVCIFWIAESFADAPSTRGLFQSSPVSEGLACFPDCGKTPGGELTRASKL